MPKAKPLRLPLTPRRAPNFTRHRLAWTRVYCPLSSLFRQPGSGKYILFHLFTFSASPTHTSRTHLTPRDPHLHFRLARDHFCNLSTCIHSNFKLTLTTFSKSVLLRYTSEQRFDTLLPARLRKICDNTYAK